MKLTVVGGSYRESCAFPRDHEFMGSGLRAALAFSNKVATEYHTMVGPDAVDLLRSVASSGGVELHHVESSCTFSFDYLHGLAEPIYYPGEIRSFPQLTVDADVVLAFGMMEGNAVVKAKTAVYDPQAPNDPLLFSANGSSAERLAIVCNQTEARKLTQKNDLLDAGRDLLKGRSSEVVIIKHGARGALVFTKGVVDPVCVPAFTAMPKSLIGSGDVFSAAFAYHWAVENLAPVDVAREASRATAFYCSTRVLPIHMDLAKESVAREAALKPQTVYLAGPFFSPSQLWMIEETRRCLAGQGVDVFSPYHDIGLGEPNVVAPQDIDAMGQCDVVFALIDEHDAGTLFEIGYARSKGKRVVVYHADEQKRNLTMLLGSDCEVYDNFAAAIYSVAWEQ